ncbi:MAG TPA: HAMP domain-containing sensor histidine kinase [Gemmatimonadales bacterium]|nr:HAMP domain-containing sensor histidine kinase [Gemmatimonadales bacterium]
MSLSFRNRILLALIALGAVPTAAALVGLALVVRNANPGTAARVAIEDVARTGRMLVETVDSTRLSQAERRALAAHAQALNDALRRVQRAETYARYYSAGLAALILGLAAIVLFGSVRLGDYLSRQLSRPIEELIRWTGHIRREEPLPPDEPERGAPEFAALRQALREMAAGLAEARDRRLEAERLAAFREMARRVAHEMKNPLTPIRFAVSQLARTATPAEREPLEVLQAEAGRLEQLAREFTELGRLPEGPAAEVDLGELLAELARTTLPPGMTARLELDPRAPRVVGHYEPLRRAFSNLLRNAVEACEGRGEIEVRLTAAGPGVEVRLTDHGPGVPPAIAGRLFEPYVTGKPGGTGLGLALVKQTVEAHGGAIRYEPGPAGGATFVVTLPAPSLSSS